MAAVALRFTNDSHEVQHFYLRHMKHFAPIFLLLNITAAGLCSAQSYFQQQVDTRIEVRLDDKVHYLHGFEEMQYTNHSPDTLRYIYIHLFPNGYRNDRTVFSEQQLQNKSTAFYYAKPAQRGFIDSLNFVVDGQKASIVSEDNTPDIARLELPKPLPPGASAKIETPFRVKIPIVFSRMGHTGQAYYISQWFPKPAVYDRKGWHAMPYTDQGEFFSEIGAYDVQITLPKNYIVMATGNLQNPEEERWLDSLAALPYPAYKVPKGASKKLRDALNKIPKSADELKTIRYTENNIHDFAFFADKRWIVRKDTVLLPGTDTPVSIWSGALPSEKEYWRHATDYMKATLVYLSREVGTYPYHTVKAVEGDLRAGGGMEYPTVTVVDRLATYTGVLETIVHEVGHNWFYGLLATNEREHPWMDEGFNTFYEQKISASLRSDTSAFLAYRLTNGIENSLYYDATLQHTDQAMDLNSLDYTKLNYGLDVYNKSMLMLRWLEGYMGQEAFTAAMKDYYDHWHFHHPYPEDLQPIFARHTGKNLDWWWKDVLTTDHRIDYAMRRRTRRGDTEVLHIRNRSSFAAPVLVKSYVDKKMTDSVWSQPFNGMGSIEMPYHKGAQYLIDERTVPDAKRSNNGSPSIKILPRIGFGAGFNRAAKEQVFALPSIGYNEYDGFMAGIVLHNLTVPGNNFRFVVAPMYATRSKEFAGAGSIGYFMHPHNGIQEIIAQVDAKTFHYAATSYNLDHTISARYYKIAPQLSFSFRERTPRLPVSDILLLKGYIIGEQGYDYTYDVVDSIYRPSISKNYVSNNYLLARFTHENRQAVNPYSYIGEAQLGGDFVKISAEGRLRIDYNTRGKSLYLRGFAGKYFQRGSSTDTRHWLATTFTGVNDYLYDDTYIGRTETDGFASHQVSQREGGFNLPTPYAAYPIGRSDDWLVSLNVKTDLPVISLPLRLYLNASTYAHAAEGNPSGDKLLYEGGIELHVFHEFLLVHAPLVLSKDYRDYMKSIYGNNIFAHSITFSLQLQRINWLRSLHDAIRYFY